MSNKFYLTTSIAYTNAAPHIGFALELTQADAVARHHRLSGDDVFFLTGTDEHGRKVAKAASDAGKKPRGFVDIIAERFKELARELNATNDYFIRTSDQKTHWPGAQKMWRALAAKEKLYRKNYQGLYCEGCEAFKKPSDLKGGVCPDHRKKPEVIEEENWFFKLSEYGKELKEIIERDALKIYPESRKNEVLAFINRGLEDVSFSRPSKDISWGVPVPDDPTQTMYVWCDALTNYLTGVGYPSDMERFKKFWPADLHIIGKDILRFHAVIWPAMLLAAELPLPKAIFVHGHIQSGGQKMSKSLGNVIDPFTIIAQYGADALRYYLLKEIPATQDGDFTHEKFHELYQADLAHELGNLVARVLALGESFGKSVSPRENNQRERVNNAWTDYREAFAAYNFSAALHTAFSLVKYANEYIDQKKPWELLGKPERADDLGRILADLVFLLGNIAWLLKPCLPSTAARMLENLGLSPEEHAGWESRALLLKKAPVLFPKIEISGTASQ